jgi:hypothetical protein
MIQRIQYLIQIIDKIAAPILEAVTIVQAKTPSQPSKGEEDAQRIAELLGRSVQVSIDLGRLVEIEKMSLEQSDSMRVALAALASPIVAAQFQALGRVPTDAEAKRFIGALESVMAFADNFSASTESIERLKNLKAQGQISDTHQIMVQYLQAFVPVVEATSAYSFGLPEKKMAQDMGGLIVKKARMMTADILGAQMQHDMTALLELAMTRVLADIYADVHRAEVAKLLAAGNAAPDFQQRGLENLVQNFEMRIALLGSMAVHIMPGQAQGNPSSGTVAPPPPPASQPSAAPLQAASPPAPPPIFTKPAESAPPVSPPASANPMAMFSKPKTPEGEAAPPLSSPPPAGSEAEAPKGNPMSFFKAPPKDEGEA